MLRSFAGGRLFGSVSGSGVPAVLCLHGWGRTHHDFDAVVRPGEDRPALDALAVDLAGFGASPAPPAAWGAAEYAASVTPLLEEMAPSVVVVGHSFGGRVAVHLAAASPDRVRALVLTGVPLLRAAPPRRPAPAFRVVRALHRAGLVGDGTIERARRRYGSADYRDAQGIMRAVHVKSVAESYEAQLDALACPVTLVWGDQDTAVPLSVAEAAVARIRARSSAPAVELVVRPGAGHLLPLSTPAALRDAIEVRCS